MIYRPRRHAAVQALNAIHRYYGASSPSSSSSSPLFSSPKKAKENHKEADSFCVCVEDYVKRATDASKDKEKGMQRRREIYAELFDYITDHITWLNQHPSTREIIVEKIRSFEIELRLQCLRFPVTRIRNEINVLRSLTSSIKHLFPFMETAYQTKLEELEAIVNQYKDELKSQKLSVAMERAKAALASLGAST